ncbi:hypothetical protein ACHRVK_15580 [Flavobacterium plurextorum]|uniref:hypothetical protein n=1 Tax=Flavobacterium TaxID=237 RepID=UPI00214D7D36|nr:MULTISPECIES: hypothetical protein [Flavobacterium]UUW11024.1 hypothetical protein NLG42_09450 [Flavobacterium plurextorum]
MGHSGKGSAISPEGLQGEERGVSLCALRLPMSNKLACFLFFFEEVFKSFESVHFLKPNEKIIKEEVYFFKP